MQSVLDEEDLGRTLLRKEVLFYHQVLEESLDHLLQALFAMNDTYFPSRKRMQQYLEKFTNKPENCYARLSQMIEDGAKEETIEKSIAELRSLVEDMKIIDHL